MYNSKLFLQKLEKSLLAWKKNIASNTKHVMKNNLKSLLDNCQILVKLTSLKMFTNFPKA